MESQLNLDYSENEQYANVDDVFEMIDLVANTPRLYDIYKYDIFKRYVEINQMIDSQEKAGLCVSGDILGFERTGAPHILSATGVPEGVEYDTCAHLFMFDSLGSLFEGIAALALIRGDPAQHATMEHCMEKMQNEVSRRTMEEEFDNGTHDLLVGFTRCKI